MDQKPSWNSLGTKRRAEPSSRLTSDAHPEYARIARKRVVRQTVKKRSSKAENELRPALHGIETAKTDNPRPVRHAPTRSRKLIAKLAQATPLSHAFRHIEPEWRRYTEYAERAARAGDEQMAKFVASYKALPKREQRAVMPESVCSLSGVEPGELISAVSRYYWEERQAESVITASANHPKMVQATAYWGQSLADCNRDRELFFRLTGGLPDKKGASIVIHNTNAPSANTLNTHSLAGANGFRTMDQRILDMGKMLDSPDESEAAPLFSKDTARVFTSDSQPED